MTQRQLHNRFFNLAARIGLFVEQLPRTYLGRHLAGQLVRSGTSPLANYAEAGAAESRRDFIHKMGICLKELRETSTWLHLARHLSVGDGSQLPALIDEVDQLMRITARSILTAKKNSSKARH
ncbi:MAG: four helix bundle protein [Rhodothermales bacterium]